MIVYVGTLHLGNGLKTIYISNERKNTSASDMAFLTYKDIDSMWIDSIIRNASIQVNSDGESIYVIDSYNYEYVMLYLVFSTRKRIYLEDLVTIYGLNEAINRFSGIEDFQGECFNTINSFMKSKGYNYCILRGNKHLYSGKIKIPLKTYKFREFFSISYIKLISVKAELFLQWRFIIFRFEIGKIITKHRSTRLLSANYKNYKYIKPASGSGSVFFKVTDDSKKYFVKCKNILGEDLTEEFKSAKRIYEMSSNKDLYILPLFPESTEAMLFFPFLDDVYTLSELVRERKLSDKEIELFIDFLVRVTDDLKTCGIIHRDIHMGNILVMVDSSNNIFEFKLLDFGCAIIDQDLPKGNIILDRKNRYAGSIYKLGVHKFNDAASSIMMVLGVLNPNYPKPTYFIKKLLKLFEFDYSISIGGQR